MLFQLGSITELHYHSEPVDDSGAVSEVKQIFLISYNPSGYVQMTDFPRQKIHLGIRI